MFQSLPNPLLIYIALLCMGASSILIVSWNKHWLPTPREHTQLLNGLMLGALGVAAGILAYYC
jgi:uncharacterized membrane protein (DUF485 family)